MQHGDPPNGTEFGNELLAELAEGAVLLVRPRLEIGLLAFFAIATGVAVPIAGAVVAVFLAFFGAWPHPVAVVIACGFVSGLLIGAGGRGVWGLLVALAVPLGLAAIIVVLGLSTTTADPPSALVTAQAAAAIFLVSGLPAAAGYAVVRLLLWRRSA